jgi:hypothetical protein
MARFHPPFHRRYCTRHTPRLPRQPPDPWTRPFPGFVLASLKASTYRPRAKSLSRQARGREGEMLRLGFSLTVASLDGLFEHPATAAVSAPIRDHHGRNMVKTSRPA